ncbi:MAG TPA: hypothetical protein VNV83_01965 [Acidimicrobiales bacterium]|jgi:hypothetical protein|nr:hypothetical protein [Acidimicrobiales bacterium]
MTTSRRPMRRRSRRLHVLATVASVGLGALAPLALLSPAVASGAPTGNTGNSGRAAVVTPLLDIFKFGNAIGLPLACSDTGSIVSIIGTQTGGTAVASKLVTELDSQCNELSSKGGDYLEQAIAQSQALTLLNPVMNPLISALATALSTVGTQEGASLSPFGPTVAGLGGTVTFFEGS